MHRAHPHPHPVTLTLSPSPSPFTLTLTPTQACIASISAEKRYFSGSGPLQAAMAPEPEDLIWENLQYTRAQRAQRIVLSTLIVIALTIVNCTAISVTQVWQSETLKAFSRGGKGAPTVFTLLGTMALCLLVLVTGYVSTIITVPVLAMKLERWHTFANREVVIALRLAVFQVPIPVSSAMTSHDLPRPPTTSHDLPRPSTTFHKLS
jgi:hypothetical protein